MRHERLFAESRLFRLLRGFDPRDNFIWESLRSRWRLELDDDAELLVYGPYGRRSYRSRATKVLVLGEPISLPIRRAYDYALSWHLREDQVSPSGPARYLESAAASRLGCCT